MVSNIRYEVALLHKEEGTITIESFDTLRKALQCLGELDLNGVSDKQLASAGLSPDSRDGIQGYLMDTWDQHGIRTSLRKPYLSSKESNQKGERQWR